MRHLIYVKVLVAVQVFPRCMGGREMHFGASSDVDAPQTDDPVFFWVSIVLMNQFLHALQSPSALLEDDMLYVL